MTKTYYRVEAWQFDNDEEPCAEEMTESETFDSVSEAMFWAWQRMDEGFQTRMYRE